jgi:hypothetical protein
MLRWQTSLVEAKNAEEGPEESLIAASWLSEWSLLAAEKLLCV